MKKFFLFFALLIFGLACNTHERKQPAAIVVNNEDTKALEIYKAPDTNSLRNDAWGELVRYGSRLVRHTSYFIGPEGTVSKNLGNKMNCNNCHLEAGTK